MTSGDTLYSIGELSRRTGLTVRTIRFYSDEGLVEPTDRTSAGYRRYDITAMAQLDLVRTLRELGVDLDTIRGLLAGERTVGEVAAAHAEALDVQIRTLRLRRAVLRAVAARGSAPEELKLMHKLARLSEQERNRILTDFIDEVSEVAPTSDFATMMRTVTPDLPDDPTPAQVDAWVEFVDLVSDPDFRARIKGMFVRGATNPDAPKVSAEAQKAVLEAAHLARQAIADGIAPESAEGGRLVGGMVVRIAGDDSAEVRAKLLDDMAAGTDARAERYWQLLAVIRGQQPWPETTPAATWIMDAIRAHPQP
ncbi:MerR family transcriptional regulator [Fodinicola acaciae]|uniref:MerR family transcriptional regulator n=1 Tax=Fodinicola acaciae TaxID=2681555 RepID=UPI0013D4F745|nr:MerR family transcriptional regulator [Fodinicola acaciae]